MSALREQLNLWWIALAFFTRVPVPASTRFSQPDLNRAIRYFPAVGWFIGVVCASVLWLLLQVFPQDIAVLLSMALSLLLTGCFHEDGLADTCDGLGGGWTPEQKLAIMKDSRIGTYGSAALWLSLTIKFVALSQLLHPVLALLIAHPLSRIAPTCLIALMPYVSESATAKAKPLAESGSYTDAIIATATGGAALLLVDSAFFYLAILALIVLFSMIFLQRQLKGFTGDALGAVQQVSELAIYLSMLVLIGGRA